MGFGDIEVAASRRLPFFLLIDTSGSMTGAPIQAVNQGLQLFKQVIGSDPMASKTAWVSVVRFGGTVEATPLVSGETFQAPFLTVDGGTPLGGALRKLNELIEQEVKLNTAEQKADFKPMVFVLTDGAPTDNWEEPLQALLNRGNRKVNIIAIGCGPDADMTVLSKMTEARFRMDEMTPEALRATFKWITQSAVSASKQASQGKPGPTGTVMMDLPAPPPVLRFGA